MKTPRDWVTRPLSQFVSLQRGFDLPTHARVPGSVPVLSSGGVNGSHNEAKVDGDNFVIGRATNIGRPTWSSVPFWPLNTTLFVKDFLGNFPKFCFYWFLAIPSFVEQRRIAGVLGALDDKIESNQAVVTRAQQLIDEIAEQKATDLPTVALSEMCSLSKSTWKPDASSNQTVHLFSLPAFDGGAVPEQAAVSSIKSNKTLMNRPGILVSRLNPRISRMWWVETDATPVSVCSPEFAYLTAGDMHGLACTWLAVRSPGFRGEIVDRVTGTSGSHQRVRPADLMTIGVPDYRSLAEHTQITVLTLLHLISARRQQSVTLAELRDALLPELMSGRMRVDEAGRLVSEALDEEVADV